MIFISFSGIKRNILSVLYVFESPRDFMILKPQAMEELCICNLPWQFKNFGCGPYKVNSSRTFQVKISEAYFTYLGHALGRAKLCFFHVSSRRNPK